MNRRARLTSALSTLAVAAVLSGCAASHQNRASIFGSKVDRANIGLATRAQAALADGQLPTAVELAERAVENTPNDAGFRALLGNIYFASGRFASAEAAYGDSLTLIPGQPEVILKLALVQIAQGKNAEAVSALAAAQSVLDQANLGLALALAGQTGDAVALLDHAARSPAADARVRQNLALAHALAGDWTMARTVAAQDVPPDQLDARIQQWMAMAEPSRPSDQVAALTGVTPAADPGQPVRLALNRSPQDNRAYARTVLPRVQPQPQPQQVAGIPAVEPPAAVPEPQPQPASAQVVVKLPPPILAVPPVPVAVAAPPAPAIVEPDPVVAEAVHALLEPTLVPVSEQPASLGSTLVPVAAEQPAWLEAPFVPAAAKPVPELPTSFEVPVTPASYVTIPDTVPTAAEKARKPEGRSNSVVQLGAYSSPERVTVAWERLTKKYPELSQFTPLRARFDGPKGTVWRLSVKGFATQRDAIARCKSLKSDGGSCFVRRAASDAPVQFASR